MYCMSYHTRSVNSPTVKRDLQKYCFTPSPHQRMAFSNCIRSPKLHNPINDMLKKIVKKRKIETRGMPELFSPSRYLSPSIAKSVKGLLISTISSQVLY
ncbi:unnamed protein product [Moneuplotes crassus]|uniref:Uncharacterized protein n=1 Tax=Euplotes crassus TaxID=5936 RepID=A0AAD2DB99_EUPCR|nr:unnamed protein product [Moneuplotes crassus]